jgi:carbamoyltransferase
LIGYNLIILGISSHFHNSAAALIINGEIIFAAEEERFSRKKNDASFPTNALLEALKFGNIKPEQLDYIVFYEKPFLKFDRLLETYFAFVPRGLVSFTKSMQIWLTEKLFLKNLLLKNINSLLGSDIDWKNKLLFSEHHLSHAASAFYPSQFEQAAILTIDGVGEWTTTSMYLGENNTIIKLKEIHFPHSLGLLYSAFTFFCGFKVNSGEYKLMGLAPFGRPIYVELIKENLIKIFEDGSFKLNMNYFNFATGLTMTNKNFSTLFRRDPRKPEGAITQDDCDLAASIQVVLEDVILNLVKEILKLSNTKNLCLAGGVALNCVANSKILESKLVENLWIQPAAGDAGGAVGAALAVHYAKSLDTRNFNGPTKDSMKNSYLGTEYDNKHIRHCLEKYEAKFIELPYKEIIGLAASALTNDKVIGWFQGRMEFGPRSLGNRAILASPLSANMQRNLNLKIKFRESFRPFAPSVLAEKSNLWFDFEFDSPYMLFVAKVLDIHLTKIIELDPSSILENIQNARSLIPAVTHVDNSSRIQTVRENDNPLFYKLISEFEKLTGVPILVNTSFNIRSEPIVESPLDAWNCFMGTDLDILIIGNFLLQKSEQSQELIRSYRDSFNLD